MTLVGLIPTISESDTSPLSSTVPIELIPIGVQMDKGVKYFKPLVQIAVEGMILGGVDHLVLVVTERRNEVMRYLGDGNYFGLATSYTYPRNPGLAWAIDSAYSLVQGCRVVMALPGITDSTIVTQTLAVHQENGAALTLSIAQGTRVDEVSNVTKITARQMTGVYVWEPAFTEHLREKVVEADDPGISFVDVIRGAISAGMEVRGVKLPYTLFVSDCSSWVRAVQLEPVVPRTTEDD
jgi:NDP-sugar pyrophosphorylase family protein